MKDLKAQTSSRALFMVIVYNIKIVIVVVIYLRGDCIINIVVIQIIWNVRNKAQSPRNRFVRKYDVFAWGIRAVTFLIIF